MTCLKEAKQKNPTETVDAEGVNESAYSDTVKKLLGNTMRVKDILQEGYEILPD